MKYIGLLSLVMVLVALLSNFIYDFAMLRYAIILLVVVIGIIFRKNIVKMFFDLKKGKG